MQAHGRLPAKPQHFCKLTTSRDANTELSGQRFQALSTCPLRAVTTAAGQIDGQFPLQADLSGLTATEIASFLVIGKEAAFLGRLRDAETAFLMSCRLADKFKGAASVESADAKQRLGGHYAKVAASTGSGPGAGPTELLYADGLNAFVGKFGETHDKSRLTAQALVAVQQSLAQVQTLESTLLPTRLYGSRRWS